MQPPLCTLREPLTLTIQFKITLNLKYSMNNKKKFERKRRKKMFQKTNFVGDFYVFRHFDKMKKTFLSVYRSALNVVKQNCGEGINTKMC